MSERYDILKHGLTQSLLSTFMECRQKAKLSLDSWARKTTSPSLQFGTMTHNILEQMYSGERSEPPSKKEIEKAIDKQINNWFKDQGVKSNENDSQQLEVHGAKLSALLPEYFRFWAKQDFQQTKWVGLEQEFEFKIPIFAYQIPLRGKVDGIYKVGKDLYLFETKTKGQIDPDAIESLLYSDLQTSIYSLAIFHLYGKYPQGVRYNIIRNPGSKPHKDETLQEYTQRLSQEVKKDPKHYFVRYRVYQPEKDLKGFEEELKEIVKDFVNWLHGALPTYKNRQACIGRYGACSMMPICYRNDYSNHYKKERIFTELSGK